MDALNEKLAALEKKLEEIEDKKRQLEDEESRLEKERRQLEEDRLKVSEGLLPHEEDQLKKDLTAVGELLELPAVIIGSLRIVSEEPDTGEKNYSIDIQCGVGFDTGLTGLSAHVTVKTKLPKVEMIAKSLFQQEGDVYRRNSSDLCWEKHWDYYTSIKLTTHEALS